jgi:chemotaxis signal transduction protein
MSEPQSAHSLGLLQFEVDEQLFAIAITDLAGVRQRQDLHPNGGGSAGGNSGSGYAALVDLGKLFFGKTVGSEGGSVLVAQAGDRLCPLLVDRVLPGTIVPSADRHPLPPPMADFDVPFTGIFFKSEQWVIIVDTRRLIERISVQYPQAIVEAILEHIE